MYSPRRNRIITLFALLSLILILIGCSSDDDTSQSSREISKIQVCRIVSPEQTEKIYRKTLIAKEDGQGCLWSIEPNGMAYFHIGVQDRYQDLRKYYQAELPSQCSLEEIDDLGDKGLMSVCEGSLGVIVIEKGDAVLQSAVTFLEIEPQSEQKKHLWNIYRTVLENL